MKRKRKWFIVFAGIICIALLGSVGYDVYKKHFTKSVDEVSASLPAVDSAGDQEKIINEVKVPDEAPNAETEDKDNQKTLLPEAELPEPESLEPVIAEPVIPKDIYILPGQEGKIKCYFPDAVEYAWEYYNESEKDWKSVSDNPDIHLTGDTDEFNRSVSTLIIKGDDNDGLLARCQVSLPDKEEKSIYQASFNVLPFTSSEIKNISIDTYHAEAGTYISTQDIPVVITKNDDSMSTITGLGSLFFCAPKDVSSDTEKNGEITVETIKTTTIEKEYHLVAAGENKTLLRYRGTEPGKDAEAVIEGTDSLPPEVTVSLSDYPVSREEIEEASITANITAVDNYTPLTKLLYAMLPSGQEPEENDFNKSSKKVIQTKENDTWTVFVKDEVGNIGTTDVEIILVDQKSPVIESLTLSNQDDGWYQENKIIVTASDKTAMKYCYLCEEYSMDSGWVDASEYEINQNGTWKVKVKDAAGNESEKEIAVTNVDATPPVILSVEPKEQKLEESAVNNGTLEDRVSVTVNGATVKDTDSVDAPSTTGSNSVSYTTTPISGIASGTNMLGSSLGSTSINSAVKGEKGEKGEKGAAGATGTAGANGKDGTSYYMHVKYAENATGANMSDAPTDSSKYIGVYTGTSSYAPSSASSYRWSQYKGSSSQLYIRYSDHSDGGNMTELPTETSAYIGICSTTETAAPNDPAYYTWSIYKDLSAITGLQEQIDNLQEQINKLKTP